MQESWYQFFDLKPQNLLCYFEAVVKYFVNQTSSEQDDQAL